MSTTTTCPDFFRRRPVGRAPSPPTWACYEQIPYDDDYSDSGSESPSCSEDEEDYGRAPLDTDRDGNHREPAPADEKRADGDMEIDEHDDAVSAQKIAEYRKDVKGKQRAIEPDHVESPRRQRERRRRHRPQIFALRPILTIQRSQGFVWNQDLFIPPYIKDRYVASTSPPNASGFVSSSVSSTNSSLMDYEVEVVEIRVKEGELKDIIP